MASKKLDSRMHSNKSDDYIQDYLSDIWGGTSESLIQPLVSEAQTDLQRIKNPSSIQRAYSLIPTIQLQAHSEGQKIRSQFDSMIILLTNLYFLRRPLPPKVRQFILDLSEQVIDDFNAAYWMQLPPLVGVENEV
mgnify:FL=1|tara:strand:+ start:22391 stop:22795 length:405 start_codon:yes stop_codon:yes gene_type:complete